MQHQKNGFFDKWLQKLKDTNAKIQILNRIARIESEGYFGDCKQIEGELSELRFFIGPGYRIYFTERNGQIIILLSGGDKSSQKRDIEKAKTLMSELP
ncbi:type II toxin-antitoxin system RelE/ParE family toxin [Marinomonas transparens]|uniref:Type II toxin-antitoxin system RelE/ParE family toxin n=1 Tax=Marinomonas transparens TaxID=2795388 RepID=A0A934JWU7_9GAMM|nr:type II toxin-antitoxin system RelE/ParE family toxin [Marinomonas transparens]MBJ7538684.1 type II toxin-antitoxin system RelE/ParE family toxin [Marinomonas transparens]